MAIVTVLVRGGKLRKAEKKKLEELLSSHSMRILRYKKLRDDRRLPKF